MSVLARTIINDPNAFSVLTVDVKKKVIKSAINTVNKQAAGARKMLVAAEKDNFVLRNNFTQKQTQFTQMPDGLYSLNVIHSSVGITTAADYMERQEKGGTHVPKSGTRLAIPTNRARRNYSFRGKVASKYLLNKIDTKKIRGAHKNKEPSHAAYGTARAYIAATKNKLVHYGKNLYEVSNFKKIDRFHPQFEIKRVYTFAKTATVTKPVNFWQKPTERMGSLGQTIFNQEMDRAL